MHRTSLWRLVKPSLTGGRAQWDPMAEGGDASDAAGRLFAQGAELAQKGLWSEAEAMFMQAGHLNPKASLPWLAAAIACWRQQRFGQAAIDIEWALHATPILDTPAIREGVARFEAGDWAGVDRIFKGLVEQPPVDTPIYLFLSIALIHLDRLPEAGKYLMAGWEQELAWSEKDAGATTG